MRVKQLEIILGMLFIFTALIIQVNHSIFSADLEAKDYRGRTPLHLAVDLYRSHAADYLISLPEPAQIRVTEQNGDMAISAMIKTMPKVVCYLHYCTFMLLGAYFFISM